MRSGKSGQWRQKLFLKQKKMIGGLLYKELKDLGYSLQ
jgi:hypothetical protein